jgi:hypothetical protein
MRPNLLSRMVLFAWMGCLAPTISAAFDEDEARGPASPPRAEAAPTIAASPGSAGERSIYIVTIGGAIAYVVVQLGTKGIELLAAGRKKWIEAETIGQNNANLLERIPPAKPPAPLSVSIDPASGPISVHEVEPPKGGAA